MGDPVKVCSNKSFGVGKSHVGEQLQAPLVC